MLALNDYLKYFPLLGPKLLWLRYSCSRLGKPLVRVLAISFALLSDSKLSERFNDQTLNITKIFMAA